MITQEELKKQIVYNRDGTFEIPGIRRKPWRLVRNDENYSIEVKVSGNYYPAEKVAWLYTKGEWRDDLFHKNKDPMDNTMSNIGVGITFDEVELTYRSISGIVFNGKNWKVYGTLPSKKRVYLGVFHTYFEACCARKSAEVNLGVTRQQVLCGKAEDGTLHYLPKRKNKTCITCEKSKIPNSFASMASGISPKSSEIGICRLCVKKYGESMYGNPRKVLG